MTAGETPPSVPPNSLSSGTPDALLLGHPGLAFPVAALRLLTLGSGVRVVTGGRGRAPARRGLPLVLGGAAAAAAERPSVVGDDVVILIDMTDALPRAVLLASAHAAHA